MIKLYDAIRKYNGIGKVKICNQMFVVNKNVKARCGRSVQTCKLVCELKKCGKSDLICVKELGKE